MGEAWLSGPVEGVPRELQPAAHALLHARDDFARALGDLTTEQLWAPVGTASAVGFNVLHACGSIERLLTYARGEQLSDDQLAALQREKQPQASPLDADGLMELVRINIDRALEVLRATRPESLYDAREVGRKKLPSNVIGLLFHTAEHTARHAGQAVSLAKVVRSS